MTTAIICTAILTGLVFLLGVNVSRLRGATAKAGGSQMPTDPASPLLVAIRAHGNATEYVPALVILFLLVGFRGPAVVAVPLIIGATLVRLIHAIALLSSGSLAKDTPARWIGALGTYLFGVALAVAAAFTI
jgi:uncharacterized membrane protein YecN with MAPEG domain